MTLLSQLSVLADAGDPPLDKRCESLELSRTFHSPVHVACMNRRDACTEERMTTLNEPSYEAEEFCKNQPLGMDPRFVGPCPLYMEELESPTYDGDDQILNRVILRGYFHKLNARGWPTQETYKRRESIQSLQRFLASNPNHFVALRSLKTRLDHGDIVTQLRLEMTLHELDPDCPDHRWLRKGSIYNRVNKLADNWLAESGPGSELSASERRELFQHARHTLLEMYDIAVEQDRGTRRLFWALESIHDAILSGRIENVQEIARRFEVDLEDYAEKRRSMLVENFAREFDVDSAHDRTQVLNMICNDYAFELGLADHCVKLLRHFVGKGSEILATAWTQAAIMLVNALTRDCSQLDLYILDGPSWMNGKRHCLAEGLEKSVEEVHTFLSRFSQDGKSAERELLEAYLRLDETSDDHFLRALAMDASIAVYAARLSNRLLKRGKTEAASNILSSIDAEQNSYLDWVERELLESVIDSYRKGSYSNSWELPRNAFQLEHEH